MNLKPNNNVTGLRINPIASNMTEVKIGDKTILVSYQTPVASIKIHKDSGYIEAHKTNKNWSRTTTRHINKWLNGVPSVVSQPQEYFDSLLNERHTDKCNQLNDNSASTHGDVCICSEVK